MSQNVSSPSSNPLATPSRGVNVQSIINPIFYDPSNQRWRRFKRIFGVLGLTLGLIFSVLTVSILIDPMLPNLPLPVSHSDNNFEAAHLSPSQSQAPPAKVLQPSMAGSHSSRNLANADGNLTSRPEVIGFFVNWDYNSFTSLKQNIRKLDKLIPEWLHLAKPNGTITVNDPIKQAEVVSFVRQQRPDLAIVPLLNNFNSQTLSWDRDILARILGNPKARRGLVQNLLDFVRRHKFAGIHIDFENVSPSSQTQLVVFMRELYAQFHPEGLEVSQSVPPDDPLFDLEALSQVNDYLVLMAYDEFASNSKPGPVASHNWYIDNLRRCLQEVPADKVVIGIGNYGYDWAANKIAGNVVSFQEILKLTADFQTQISMDPVTLNPTFHYDHKGVPHRVWFLDAVTAFNQLLTLQREVSNKDTEHRPRGIALWRLGSEDPSIWDVLAGYPKLDRTVAQKLQLLHYGYDLEYQGEGEVLKVTSLPNHGRREFDYDPQSGLITQERLLAYSSPYVITRWGQENPKKVALSFDDGPDATYTPQILEILRRYQVKATFFVIGHRANRNRWLLQRMVREGHEIGNHTFLHPLPSTISPEQLRLELNASQRLFESYLGRRSLLFRPPYGEDVDPVTPGEVGQLVLTGKLGYYTVGMHVEPDDWRNPGVDQIVNATMEQVSSGQGNVVLLHDGGGDRSQTVTALPQIIEGLRERGFDLVGISELIGLSRDDVMPLIHQEEMMRTKVNGIGFFIISGFSTFVFNLFLLAMGLSLARLLWIGTLAVFEGQKRCHTHMPDYQPHVTVIVPAFNEEKVIVNTISALLVSHYPKLDVIIIDDGSLDGTYQRAVATFGNDPHVRVLRQPRVGKAQALNYGIQSTRSSIIVTIDADTIVVPNAITQMVRHFVNPRIGAIAGNVKVGNRRNPLTYWQALEYITSQNLERRAFALLNGIFVVPGAIGAWRRDVILQAGGFTNETVAEDADLTLNILRMGYRVDYEQEAIALTEAPETVSGFLRQRFRWLYGVLQAAWKHRHTLFRLRYGGLGMFAIPNVLILQVGLTLVAPFIDIFMLITVAEVVWQQFHDPNGHSMVMLQKLFSYYLLFLVVDFLAAWIAFMLEHNEERRLIFWLIPQRFFYRQLMYYVAIKALLKAIQGTMVGWKRVERRSTVKYKLAAKKPY